MPRLPMLLAAAAGGSLLCGAAWAQLPAHADPYGEAARATQPPADQDAAPDQSPAPDPGASRDQGQAPDSSAPRSSHEAGDASGSAQDTAATTGDQPPKHRHKAYDYGRTDDGTKGASPPSDDAAHVAPNAGPPSGSD